MKFLALLAAILLEQFWPLRRENRAYLWFNQYAASLESHFNTGQYRHAVTAWVLAAGPVIAAAAVINLALYNLSPALAWLWNILVLYLAMGFRQFGEYFTGIRQALNEGNVALARDLLGEWRGQTASEFSEAETARVTIEQGLLASHRYLFGTIAWFVALGPAGAALYRASDLLAENWGGRSATGSRESGRIAERLFSWLDWVPARITAATFAIVGNFEDAVYCWRTQAFAWTTRAQGIILASGGGALGVRLGDVLHQNGSPQSRPALGVGDEADVDYLQSAVGLIWRSLVLWMFLVLVVTVVRFLG